MKPLAKCRALACNGHRALNYELCGSCLSRLPIALYSRMHLMPDSADTMAKAEHELNIADALMILKLDAAARAQWIRKRACDDRAWAIEVTTHLSPVEYREYMKQRFEMTKGEKLNEN